MSFQTDLVQSPCIRNCCLDDQDICLGCFRDLEEIKAWAAADNAKRRLILANASSREAEKLSGQN
jgi:predicted Fe-S protein YdhL (DUF1289 family)